MAQLNSLFQPGRIGDLELKNRLVMAAMGCPYADQEGYITQKIIDYYAERARGGVGFIITSIASFLPEARFPNIPALHHDKFIPGMKQLAHAIQSCGARIACQLAYQTYMDIGPSAIPCFTYQVTPKEISQDEIHRIIEAHAEAGRRCKEAGFDAVEIHAAHGYFLSAFLSPFRNRRTDEYGGSVNNRARFAYEVVARTREKVGPDFPVLIRMNGSDFLEGGLTINEAQQQAVMFVEAGADAIDVTAATPDSRQWRDLTYMHPDGAIVHLAEAIKKAVKVPVITVGKIGDPVLANNIIKENRADFVAMARALLADPELPNKAKEGRFDDIRKCLYCNNCRIGRISPEGVKIKNSTETSCTVNPALMREQEFKLKPAALRKKVIFIGGGLAGMEVARISAERGHEVYLYEKTGELGGQWNIACSLPAKAGFRNLLQHMVRGLDKAGVKVILNKEVTRHFIEEEKPDVVVVATGATVLTLDVPGSNGKNVVQAVDVIAGKANMGNRVVVIGGKNRGMEVADFLATQGKKISLITRNRLGGRVPIERNTFVTLRERLVERGVVIFPFSMVFEIRDNGVYMVSDNELLFLPADTVVMAIGAKSENKLSEELQGIVPELYAFGDCVLVRNAKEAVNEGYELGYKM
jgi:2,4-dienoyl-CoA reductase-like NADH-dependent reductase (Old Yellow Enzyme family)/thioredoxin reductase